MTSPHQKHIDLATQLYSQQKFHDAARILEAVLKSEPHNADAMYIMGLYQWRFANAPLGIRYINQALELRPEFRDFDHQHERILNQGMNMLNVWEVLYSEYLRFKDIDAFLISFPKCGRTWLRALLGWYVNDLAAGDPMEVLELTRNKPDYCTLDISHDDFPHLITADQLFTNKKAYKDKKVIFMIRDPRDVVVSNYFQFTKRGDQTVINDDFDGSLSEFIRHKIGGLENLVRFYNIWAENKSVPEAFLEVSYEDMSASPKDIFLKCIDFLQWPEKPESLVDQILAKGSFNSMRQMESSNELQSVRLTPSNSNDPEGFKTRKGKVGGYVDYLSDEDQAYVSEYLNAHLHDHYTFYKG